MSRFLTEFRGRMSLWSSFAILAAFVALTLGIIGFYPHIEGTSASGRFFDALYLSLQLFVLEGGVYSSTAPSACLWLARYLAPVAGIVGVARILPPLIDGAVRSRRTRLLSRLNNHYLLCGSGPLIERFCEDLLDNPDVRQKVVILTPHLSDPLVKGFEHRGAIVEFGDCTDGRTLRRVSAEWAAVVVAADASSAQGDDDFRNVNTALQVQETKSHTVLQSGVRTNVASLLPEIFVHIGQPDLLRAVDTGDSNILSGSGNLVVFNRHDVLARHFARIIVDDPGLESFRVPGSRPYLSLILVEPGIAGQFLAIRCLQRAVYPARNKVRIRVVSPDWRSWLDSVQSRYPGFLDVCVFEGVASVARSREGLNQIEKWVSEDDAVSRIALLCQDDVAMLADATSVRDVVIRAKPAIPARIFARISRVSAVVGSLEGSSVDEGLRLEVLAADGLAASWDDVYGKNLDHLAMLLNDAYRDVNSIGKSWSEISHEMRESNRCSADHVGVKQWVIGYERSLTDDQIELLAWLEHERWMNERKLAGWRSGETKDVERRLTPYFVPYSELSEKQKQNDRAMVLSILKLIWDDESA